MGDFAAPGQDILWRGGRRVVVGEPASGALVADTLLHFVNGIYRVDGTTYATAALAGFPGAGTFNASGYTATGVQGLIGSLNLPGDFVIFAEYVIPTAASRQLWLMAAGPYPGITLSGAGEITTFPATATSTTATRIAFGRSGGVTKRSYDQGAVATGPSLAAPGSGSLYIGNSDGATMPWGAAIKSLAICKISATDAQYQGWPV